MGVGQETVVQQGPAAAAKVAGYLALFVVLLLVLLHLVTRGRSPAWWYLAVLVGVALLLRHGVRREARHRSAVLAMAGLTMLVLAALSNGAVIVAWFAASGVLALGAAVVEAVRAQATG